jgi:hypothetical protein
MEGQKRVTATFSASVPFNLTKDYYRRILQPFVNYRFVNSVINGTDKNYRYFQTGAYFYACRFLARNDIFPRFGLQAWLNYVGHPDIDMSELLIAKVNIYLPGILVNQGLRLSASHQKQFVPDKTMYYFPEQYVDIARGHYYYNTGKGAKNLYTVKADYSFPIIYPDLKLGSMMYLSRIRGNLFYDLTANSGEYKDNHSHITGRAYHRSYGMDLMLDMYFFRIKYAPATLMFRLIKIPGQRVNSRFSIGVNF